MSRAERIAPGAGGDQRCHPAFLEFRRHEHRPELYLVERPRNGLRAKAVFRDGMEVGRRREHKYPST